VAEYLKNFFLKFRRNFRKFRPGIPSFEQTFLRETTPTKFPKIQARNHYAFPAKTPYLRNNNYLLKFRLQNVRQSVF
jgi:hypothetical protein